MGHCKKNTHQKLAFKEGLLAPFQIVLEFTMSCCQSMRHLPVLASQCLGAATVLEVTQAVGTQQQVAEDGGAPVLHVGIGELISSFSSSIAIAIIHGEVEFSSHHRGWEP